MTRKAQSPERQKPTKAAGRVTLQPDNSGQPDTQRARARGSRHGKARQSVVTDPSSATVKRSIVEHLATTGDTIAEACRKLGLPRSTFYDWKKADRDFAAMVEHAYDMGDSVLEQELTRRGMRGNLKAVWHQGAICGYVREKSDGALMFVLNRRERLRGMRLERTSALQFGRVSLDLAKMSPDLRKLIRAELERQQRVASEGAKR